MKRFKTKKCKKRTVETHNGTSSECRSENETFLQHQKFLDNSTISNEYQRLHFSADELDSLLKKYGLDSFDWSSMI